MTDETSYIRINSDEWQDVGVVYKVLEHFRHNPESTAVELKLEKEDGTVIQRVVANHWIEWVEQGV